ncbi:transposase family protein [Actinomadura sp. BRA 177]|uniref:transposase family protein n=1 Tax=Actinomadura sp. BRA 177 TaxID=2745202 RepID=UPI00159553B2|nr:transposase family protein [Actinomadura sp. BRA 177]NVI86340.1 transposase family protein [Actinomadura sp. BRA 177]
MLFYRAGLDLSRSTLNYVAGLIRRRRKAIGSTWRLLNPGQQALLVLAYLRKDETFTEISTGFGVSPTTAWRYVEETVMLLSARSPKLAKALRKASRDGLTHLVLDGTLIHTDRVRADRPYYSGKHRVHGMNVQVIAGPDGTILWTSGALPGKVHDLTAARIWGILRELERTGILTLADKAYQGAEASVVITPYKGRNKPESQKQANRSHAKLRGPGERANAQLKSWRILRKLRCSPSKAGHIVKAIAVLQNHRVAQTARG